MPNLQSYMDNLRNTKARDGSIEKVCCNKDIVGAIHMIETLLTEIAEAGWTLGYLRQAGVGWEVQLKRSSGKGGFDISFHYDNTPSNALEGALTQGEAAYEKPLLYTIHRGVDILADLGLIKPINRRF